MLQRRPQVAGYDRRCVRTSSGTFAPSSDGDGGEGDLMRLMGWADRSMLDRYGADLQVQRAVRAKRRDRN